MPPVPVFTRCSPNSLLSPREASCLHIETFSDKGRRELSRGQDSVLRDWGSKARVDSCASQTLFLEKNSLLPTTWSSFLESCPSVYVLKTSLHVCSVEPGTAAWRKHGLQMDREEGVQRGQRTKPGKFPSGPVSERRAPASGPQKKRVC